MDDAQSHLSVFGLEQQPFAPTADPHYFYATREHKSCLFRLWSSIDERHGIAVVLGNYGTGKTTILRKLMMGMSADPERYNTAVVGSPIPSWTSFALLEAIVKQFGLEPSERSFTSYMESLNQYLLANRERVSTLIIDDAQNLNKRGQLELLRLAQNLETRQHKLLNLVLFAQLEWLQVLHAAPNFEQRINMTYTLAPLTMDEARSFIAFRLTQAGGADERAPAFDDDAVAMIHAYSDGNPRLIVTLCRNSLLFASQIKTRQITQDIVLHTIEKAMVPDDEKRARAMAVLRTATPSPPAVPAPIVIERPFSDSTPARRPRAIEEKANQLLIRAAKEDSARKSNKD